MRRLKYQLVDVFTNKRFAGNQLAVFTNGRGVPGETMQAITREMNLSECTFILPPDDPAHEYRVRIFTPGMEMPMAGHPTVGTSYILAREQMIDRSGEQVQITLEEGVGPIPVTINFEGGQPSMIWMTQPPPEFGPRYDDRAAIAEMLTLPVDAISSDLPIEMVSCGVPFLYVPIKDLESIHRVQLRRDLARRFIDEEHADGIFVFTLEVENQGSGVHSRMFAPELGVTEDPATGAASGPLGSYLVHNGLAARIDPGAQGKNFTFRTTSEQGIEIGRPSFIHIEIEQQAGEISAVRIGGQCVYVGEGALEID